MTLDSVNKRSRYQRLLRSVFARGMKRQPFAAEGALFDGPEERLKNKENGRIKRTDLSAFRRSAQRTDAGRVRPGRYVPAVKDKHGRSLNDSLVTLSNVELTPPRPVISGPLSTEILPCGTRARGATQR